MLLILLSILIILELLLAISLQQLIKNDTNRKKSTYRRMTMKTQAIEVTNLAKSFELSKGKTIQILNGLSLSAN